MIPYRLLSNSKCMNRSTFFVILWLHLSFYSYFRAEELKLKQDNGRNSTHYPALIFKLNSYEPQFWGKMMNPALISKPNNYVTRLWENLTMICYRAPFITACPASSEQEIKFNREVSITGKSVFLKTLYSQEDNITRDFCEKPIEPSIVYNAESCGFEIGYELYYDKDSIKRQDQCYDLSQINTTDPWYSELMEEGRVKLEKSNYHRYKPVNMNNEIINQTKPSNQHDFQHPNDTQFLFTDGSQIWAFYWIPELSIEAKGYKRKIDLTKDFKVNEFRSKCENFVPESHYKKMEFHVSSRKDVAISQIIPLWYFPTDWGKLASCTHMNMISVWKTIAEGQLKKVDLYLQALVRRLMTMNYKIKHLIFGTCGTLTLGNTTNQEIHLSSTQHHRQHIPVPKIIYRVVEAEYKELYDPEPVTYHAIVVIHNDPTGVSDGDRVCTRENTVPGWRDITNDDPKTGITYVCRYEVVKFISNKLGICIAGESSESAVRPLELQRLRVDRFYPFRDMEFKDEMKRIRDEFNELQAQQV